MMEYRNEKILKRVSIEKENTQRSQTCFTEAALLCCLLKYVDLTHFTPVILIRNSLLITQ